MLFLLVLLFYISNSFASQQDSDYVNSTTTRLVAQLYKIIEPEIRKKRYDSSLSLSKSKQEEIAFAIQQNFSMILPDNLIPVEYDKAMKLGCSNFFVKYAAAYRFDLNSKLKIAEMLGGEYITKTGSSNSLIEYSSENEICYQGSFDSDSDSPVIKIIPHNNHQKVRIRCNTYPMNSDTSY